ncbi:MAG: 3-deoxy-7-phosphoheptulonate synthase [Oscillospiraceae bacterium]|nr:3-deoxy-7-phosphoheptulonate synthase [Oscillospiraceae bacterium]
MNMEFKRKLPTPQAVKDMYPISPELVRRKHENDSEIRDVFTGKSDRLILIIGPCSADREDAVLEYRSRLRAVQEKVRDKLLIIPRIYTNKPRTTGDGYKGMLHQPDPNSSPDMLRGIISTRKLHIKAIEQTGFSCADEMLYPENYRYLSDLLGYVAIGARSVENQQHRLTASGMDIPVGMKNPTSGEVSVMMNSIIAAQTPHTFIYRGWEVETTGNELTHAILRGFVSDRGYSVPNYHYENLLEVSEAYDKLQLKNKAVIIDTNHANSGKKYLEQIRISHEVMDSRRYSKDIRNMVKGLMIESYIEDGTQNIGEDVYGKSITDPCLGWEKSEKLIYEIAEML